MGVNTMTLILSCPVMAKVMSWMMKLWKPFCQRTLLQDSDSDCENTDDTDPVTLQRQSFTYSSYNAILHKRHSVMKPTTCWIKYANLVDTSLPLNRLLTNSYNV